MNNTKVILLILDGWGYKKDSDHNAVALSNPINFNKLLNENNWTLIDASEEAVGLPKGQMGNSEVGHTNIGAGRIVFQDFLKITKDITSGNIKYNSNITKFIEDTIKSSGRLHLIGLVSDGGVHSHIDHIKGIAKLAKDMGIHNTYIHAFTDGRDTPPNSGLKYIGELQQWLDKNNAGNISDICGRYYGMDRDNRWDRIERAWKVISENIGEFQADSPQKAVEKAYKRGETDEFIKPTSINKIDGSIKDNDSIFFINFRADRIRELLQVVVEENFNKFKHIKKLNLKVLTMTEYDKNFNTFVAYPPERLKEILGEIISNNNMKQLRIAETEKYAHVTYFFNGGREEPFKGELRELIESPRDIPTYDLKPEMGIFQVTQRFEELFKNDNIDIAVINFANPDMVGHTGVEKAAIKACKYVDECLGKVIKIADEMDAILFITADHGNSECMWDYENNQPHTSHTLNPVVFIAHNCNYNIVNKKGKLSDIAPTILHVMGIPKPKKMTGQSLFDDQ